VKVAFVGRGKVGRALYGAAKRAGLEATSTTGRDPSQRALAGAGLVVLAVPDAAIGEAGLRAFDGAEAASIVHCAGALGPAALAAAAARGASVGAMHPLVSFADAARPPSLVRALFLIDGDPRATKRATALVKALGGRPLKLEAHGPAYHAAAALAANGAAALAYHAVRVLEAIGFEPRDASEGIAALLESVAENVRRVGVPRALTGPVFRGDAATVVAHRRALSGLDAHAAAAYDGIAASILACAEAAGLTEAKASAVRAALRWKRVPLSPPPKTPSRRSGRAPRR
jgi:predicted short-subunit dehydrogenase-like oxidoreductase (DUF2520 family)